MTFLKTAWHYILLLAGIGAVSGLSAAGHLTSTAAGLIGTFAGGGFAGGLSAQVARNSATTLQLPSSTSSSTSKGNPPA